MHPEAPAAVTRAAGQRPGRSPGIFLYPPLPLALGREAGAERSAPHPRMSLQPERAGQMSPEPLVAPEQERTFGRSSPSSFLNCTDSLMNKF